MNRRRFLEGSAIAMGSLAAASLTRRPAWAQGPGPAVVTSEGARPAVPYGVQSGDVTSEGAIVWSRSDRASRLIVEWATSDSFQNAQRIIGPAALAENDFTARVDLRGLPASHDIFYRVVFQNLAEPKAFSAPVAGRFRTPPAIRRTVTFAFSGDEVGQGWGINADWGGMKMYEVMRRTNPDFFIHSGDQIYADGPLKSEVALDDGTIWKNLTTPEKSKVAETLAEFRGNFAYNLLDANKRRFAAEVPFLVQWDDHETKNNWFPGEDVSGDKRYKVASASLLAAAARRAMFDFNPIRPNPDERERVYRRFGYGPLLEIFMLDERSYRGPNGANLQSTYGPESYFLGPDQLAWLKRALLNSRATWKVIASDMPLSIIVYDDAANRKGSEAFAQGDGPPRGRELEIADILRFIKTSGIVNTVWLTADVHYAAAHYYNPDKAQFQEFDPFWEFVSGPLHAGTFGPNELDNTFGPEVKFIKAPGLDKQNLPPSAGMQFFGHVKIDGASGQMTVTLRDRADVALWSTTLDPRPL